MYYDFSPYIPIRQKVNKTAMSNLNFNQIDWFVTYSDISMRSVPSTHMFAMCYDQVNNVIIVTLIQDQQVNSQSC